MVSVAQNKKKSLLISFLSYLCYKINLLFGDTLGLFKIFNGTNIEFAWMLRNFWGADKGEMKSSIPHMFKKIVNIVVLILQETKFDKESPFDSYLEQFNKFQQNTGILILGLLVMLIRLPRFQMKLSYIFEERITILTEDTLGYEYPNDANDLVIFNVIVIVL